MPEKLEARKREVIEAWRRSGGRLEHGDRMSIPAEALWAFLSAIRQQWAWDDLARVVGRDAAEKLKGRRPGEEEDD